VITSGSKINGSSGAGSGRYEHLERLSVRFFPFPELTPDTPSDNEKAG
jgi:hypothetical protein